MNPVRRHAVRLSLVIVVVLVAASGAREPPNDDVGCTTAGCHDSLLTSTVLHRPVERGACSVCHREAEGEHAFALVRAAGDLCSTCHAEIDRRTHVHEDLSETACGLCHDPHGSGHPALLPSDDVTELCIQCHTDVLDQRDHLHTPVAARDCTVCHDPHVATSGAPIEDRRNACLDCHTDLRQAIDAGTAHAPLVTGACEQCHDPHGSSVGANLVDRVPDLCNGCHESTWAHVESAAFPHSAASREGGCVQCHDPHASAYPTALRAAPAAVCASCHDETLHAHGAVVTAVSRTIDASAYAHGPVQQQDCSACHDVHGSGHAGLLVDRVTPDFYTSFDLDEYALCFTCHDSRIVLEERTRELTDFRDGDLNLHYLHVNRADRGRTCRACHATHASNAPHHIRDSVPYGGWDLPIGFEDTIDGGRCSSGCHVTLEYDRARGAIENAIPTEMNGGQP